MIRNLGGITFAAVAAFALNAADPPRPIVKSEEKTRFQAAIAKVPEFEALAKEKRVVASSMTRYKAKPEGANSESEFVESLHFNYDDGKTIRTVYNATLNKAVKVESLEAYPTPLAEEEVAEAKKLAKEKDQGVKALLQKYKEEQISIKALAPVYSDRKHPRFGKRIVILQWMPKAKISDGIKTVVNLTDKSVTQQ